LAAIAAAALAGLAVLPALLNDSEPPPLPADVGLAPATTPAPDQNPAPSPLTPPAQRRAHGEHSKAKRRKTKRAPSAEALPRGRRSRRTDLPVRSRRTDRQVAPVTVAAPAPSPPVFVDPQPVDSPEFSFER
jgi:hypothetical protein